MEALALAAKERFGVPPLVFNNVGVGAGGLVWENTVKDWEWGLGVNRWGVVHGVRLFTPMMLGAAPKDPVYQGHIVNTPTLGGSVEPAQHGGVQRQQARGGVVVRNRVPGFVFGHRRGQRPGQRQRAVPVLCRDRHQPEPPQPASGLTDADETLTSSQMIVKAMTDKAVGSGKVTAAQVAQKVFDAVAANQFYIYSHPKAIGSVQTRLEDMLQARNPTDPFADRPEIGVQLKAALRKKA